MAAALLDVWLGGHYLSMVLSSVLVIGLLSGARAAIVSVLLDTLAIRYVLADAVGFRVAYHGDRNALFVFVLTGIIISVITGRARENHLRLIARRAQVTRLREIASEFSAAATPEQVAEVAAAACKSVAASCVCIERVGTNASLEMLHRSGDALPCCAFGAGPENPSSIALRTAKPLWLTSPAEIDSLGAVAAAASKGMGVVAWAAVPLMSRGQAIGVLGVGWTAPIRLSQADREFVEAVGANAAQSLDRARLYEEARERERWFRMLAENAPDMLFRYRVKGLPGFEYVSPSAAALTGYTEDEFYANPALALTLLHPDDAPTMVNAVCSTAAITSVVRWITRDKRTLHVDLRTSPILDRDGELVAVEGIARDVTERAEAQKTTERLLDENQRRAAEISAVLDSMADGVIVTDAAGHVQWANRTAQSLGAVSTRLVTREEIDPSARERDPIPRDRLTTIDGQAVALEQAPAHRALRGEVVRGALYRVRPREPDGRSPIVSVSAAPIVDPEGRKLGAVVTLADVTRIHELQREREDFLHAVSHDVRTPLQSVLLRASLLSKHACPDSEDVQKASRAILENVRKMNVAVQEVLEMAQLSAGELKPQREAVAAMPFLTEMTRRLFSSSEVSRISVHADPSVAIISDPHHLERIVTNLLTNALKYSKGPVEVSARPEGRDVVISVADQGPGIPAEDLPRVFDRFFRGGHRSRGDGFGLGLYVTRRLAEAQGGSVSAKSSPGGSVFEVRLHSA